jgi:hypothetical protein
MIVVMFLFWLEILQPHDEFSIYVFVFPYQAGSLTQHLQKGEQLKLVCVWLVVKIWCAYFQVEDIKETSEKHYAALNKRISALESRREPGTIKEASD